jgi:hypothetical protein
LQATAFSEISDQLNKNLYFVELPFRIMAIQHSYMYKHESDVGNSSSKFLGILIPKYDKFFVFVSGKMFSRISRIITVYLIEGLPI